MINALRHYRILTLSMLYSYQKNPRSIPWPTNFLVVHEPVGAIRTVSCPAMFVIFSDPSPWNGNGGERQVSGSCRRATRVSSADTTAFHSVGRRYHCTNRIERY